LLQTQCLAQNALLPREEEHGSAQAVEVLLLALDAAEILDAVVLALLKLLQLAASLVDLVESIDQPRQRLRLPRPDQEQSLLLLRLVGRAGPVGQHDRIAQDVIAKLLGTEAEKLLQEKLRLLQLPPLRRCLERRAEGRVPQMFGQGGGSQGGGVSAQVAEHETE